MVYEQHKTFLFHFGGPVVSGANYDGERIATL